MRWSTILPKWHLLHKPTVAGLWCNTIPHLIHVTSLTVPSNNMQQWHNWQLHQHYHHVWRVDLHLECVTRILFRPQKHFMIESCSRLQTHLKRELSHEKRLPEIILTTKHILCDSLVSVSLSSITNTGQNDFITRSLLWSNTVKCRTPTYSLTP